jgi:hypothetical protein
MRILITLVLSIFITACAVNEPVTSSQIVSNDPLITFDVNGYDAEDLMLQVDGLEYGSISKYLNTRNALKLIPGQHTISIFKNGMEVYSDKQYFGESTTAVIKVSQ